MGNQQCNRHLHFLDQHYSFQRFFPDFSTPMIILKDFQGLENFYIKFQDFSYFSDFTTYDTVHGEAVKNKKKKKKKEDIIKAKTNAGFVQDLYEPRVSLSLYIFLQLVPISENSYIKQITITICHSFSLIISC